MYNTYGRKRELVYCNCCKEYFLVLAESHNYLISAPPSLLSLTRPIKVKNQALFIYYKSLVYTLQITFLPSIFLWQISRFGGGRQLLVVDNGGGGGVAGNGGGR